MVGMRRSVLELSTKETAMDDIPYGSSDVPVESESRAECPPADVIIDYIANDLTLKVRARVDAHVPTCRHCAIELKAIRAALEEAFGSPSANTTPDAAE